jgi:preprotein translocase subunit SecE
MDALETVKQPINRSVEFLQECWAEVKKVHFPTRRETQAATIVVIIGVTIIALYLGFVDFVLSWVIHRVLSA